MKISHIEHLGIAVKSIEEALPYYEKVLGLKCYNIETIEDGVANALASAEAAGIRLIDKVPRKGAEGLNIAFLHPKSTLGVLTELCEKPE